METENLYKMAHCMFQKEHIKYDEDDIQDAVMAAWNALKKYDKRKGEESTFVYKCMLNNYYNSIIKENRKKRIPEELISKNEFLCSESEGKSKDPDLHLIYLEVKELISDMLEDKFLNNMTFKELSKKYDLPIESVKYQIYKELKDLENYFKKNGNYDLYKQIVNKNI